MGRTSPQIQKEAIFMTVDENLMIGAYLRKDKENFKIDHPELEDVRDIIEEIDRNNVKLKEESSFYINALKIKKWMEDNQTTKPPRSQYKSRKTGENAVPIEEARLGDRLSDIKLLLISPYKKLENDEDKKDFKKEHPEIEDVLKIVEWMESHIPEKLRQAQEILEWMKKIIQLKLQEQQ